MTGEDHITDALIAALRSPALPAERVGEAAAIAAMREVLPTTVPVRPTGLRSRRGIAIAAVTVASLGVGGLVAAGPGIFQPAADKPPVGLDDGIDDGEQGGDRAPTVSTAPSLDDSIERRGGGSGAVQCADGPHGKTVSSIAKTTEPGPDKGETVSSAAQSDCGKNGESEQAESKAKGSEGPSGNDGLGRPSDTRPAPPNSDDEVGKGSGSRPED